MAGENFSVRATEPEDYEAVREVLAAPNAVFGTLQLPLPSKKLWLDRLAQPRADNWQYVAVVQERPVGHAGLTLAPNPRRRHVGSIGMAVHDDFAGRGLGDALMRALLELADNWLALRRVELTVFVDNERAIRLYERHGFVREGVLKDYAFRAGRYEDAFSMARFSGG